MNASKVRDLFSAYYEGDLSSGLREAFDRALATDSALKVEYDEFCSAMKLLAEPESDIEVPFDLHEKIMARLDLQEWEVKQTTKASFWGRWRLAMVGGLATVAIVAGVLSVNSRGNEVSNAGFVPGASTQVVVEKVDAAFVDGSVVVQITAKSGSAYSVRKVSDNSLLADLKVGKGLLSQSIVNEDRVAQAFSVVDAKGEEKLFIVLPGTAQGTNLKGEGTVLDLSLSMADAFRTPLVVRANDRSKSVHWDFKVGSSMSERSTMLESQGLNLSLIGDRISLLSSF
ncbi:MAG: anti-sigma factor family protein [Fimbriimonadaceae bacterium]